MDKQYLNIPNNKYTEYLDLILEKNEHINLTAIRDRDEAYKKHIIDSLTCINEPEFIAAENIVDMGTGAGFPGVPLAISAPDKDFLLIDSLNKRLKIIDEFTGKLEINNITTLHGRAEDIGQNSKYREKFDLCVSRAVASLDVLVEWCLPLIKPGGYLIAYKGENVSRETLQAEKAIKVLGGKLKEIRNIKDTITVKAQDEKDISGHVLVIIEKVSKTPNKYPRPAKIAKGNPIK